MIVAPSGSGKTYTVSQSIKEMERVAVFDMVHEPAYLAPLVEANDKLVVGNPAEFARAIAVDRFKVCYRPTTVDRDERRPEEVKVPSFGPWIKLCYLRGNMTAVIDEAHLLCNPYTIPRDLFNACVLGRHRRLNLIFVTQSFSAVHRFVTRNAHELVFFNIIEPNDLEGIRKRCGMDVAARVSNLRRLSIDESTGTVTPGEMIHWSARGGGIIGDDRTESSNDDSSDGSTDTV